jgi:hypothetical protein
MAAEPLRRFTMALFNKFNSFESATKNGEHALNAHTLQVALSAVAPDPVGDKVLADISEISYTNLSSLILSVISSGESVANPGRYELIVADINIAASGGDAANWRYLIIYNTTQTSPLKPLIGYYDYGVGGITLLDGQSLDVDFDALTNRVISSE